MEGWLIASSSCAARTGPSHRPRAAGRAPAATRRRRSRPARALAAARRARAPRASSGERAAPRRRRAATKGSARVDAGEPACPSAADRGRIFAREAGGRHPQPATGPRLCARCQSARLTRWAVGRRPRSTSKTFQACRRVTTPTQAAHDATLCAVSQSPRKGGRTRASASATRRSSRARGRRIRPHRRSPRRQTRHSTQHASDAPTRPRSRIAPARTSENAVSRTCPASRRPWGSSSAWLAAQILGTCSAP